MRKALAERFWSKVEIVGPCWQWTGATDGRYGSIWADGRLKKAHRVAYELVVGPIYAGFEIDHLCTNTLCVRPAHLEVVTGLTNLKRQARVRPLPEHCPKGHPKTPDNVRVSRGFRLCRTCEQARRAARRSAA